MLDVHNAYDMSCLSHDPVARTLTLSFEANPYVLPNKPAAFQLCVTDLTSLEYNLTAAIPYDFHVKDITWREPADRDYDITFSFDDDLAEGTDLVLTLGSGSYLRIAAGEANVLVAG